MERQWLVGSPHRKPASLPMVLGSFIPVTDNH